jgi:thioredoxin reductase
MRSCDVAVVGAGPYGLSIAAHLRAARVDFRIFGKPMGFWLDHMPVGMHLKSEGFASSLYEPRGMFTLRSYCEERGIEYADVGRPVRLDVFTAYGLEFQRKYVPNLERKQVTMIQPSGDGFLVTLENGERFTARRVVIAVGQSYYANLPQQLTGFPKTVVTHSSDHTALDEFRGKVVLVLGAGASALDLAALLYETGGCVEVAARASEIRYHDPVGLREQSFVRRLLNPVTGIGPGWKLWLCTNLPLIFRLMPEQFRIEKVRRILGPAPCYFIKERVVEKVRFHLGVSISSLQLKEGRINVELVDGRGSKKDIYVDHVIAATGFKSDYGRLTFLSDDILSKLERVGCSPALSKNFESSVRNLYFVGVTAANTFGPLLRFAFGARFTAPRIANHLARTAAVGSGTRGTRSNAPTQIEKQAAEPIAR